MASPTRCLVEIRAGSHLYGTAIPASDTDLKAIHLPSARDILLQRARPAVTEERTKERGERNLPGDVDRESYSLQRFREFVLAGQPLAVEMLFAPDAVATAPPDPLWRTVQALAPRLVSRQVTPFLRYCRCKPNATAARAPAPPGPGKRWPCCRTPKPPTAPPPG